MRAGNETEPINRDAVTFTINIPSDVLAGVQAVLEAALAHSGKVSIERKWSEAAHASGSHEVALTPQYEPCPPEASHIGHEGLLLGSNTANAALPSLLLGNFGLGRTTPREQAAGAIGEGIESAGEEQEGEEMLSEGAVDDLAGMDEQMGFDTGVTPSSPP